MHERAGLLDLLLSPDLVAALDDHIRDIVAEVVLDERARAERREWLPISDAAARLGCTTDAVRMRVKRKTIESRRQGRRIYVRLDAASRDNGSVPWPTTKRAPARRESPGA